jgi:Xaa-Pro aminopeptidase
MDGRTRSDRRQALRAEVPDGAILISGNVLMARNYVDNHFPFRQDSHFLYYVGVIQPEMALLIYPGGEEVLFGYQPTLDDFVWNGPMASLEEHAAEACVSGSMSIDELGDELQRLKNSGARIHYLPPYSAERSVWLSRLLGLPLADVATGVSDELVKVIVQQRSIKTEAEIESIEKAVGVTAEMYQAAMTSTAPGKNESDVVCALRGAAIRRNMELSFLPICTTRGEVLHNNDYTNQLAAGDLLLIDSGAETTDGYAADITRTFPVSGSFTELQKEIYSVVLAAQEATIAKASPACSNRDLHMTAVHTIAAGLNDLGLMKGNVDDSVAVGAHALFMPHGIGHMLGLDVHDMEDLGDVVGYPEGEERSTQFGLGFLRLARKLEPGFVITVEPGVYFNPELINRWKAESKHTEFIAYERLDAYDGFGGIRIEDDVLITETGSRVLGPGIPKQVDEVEAAVGQ